MRDSSTALGMTGRVCGQKRMDDFRIAIARTPTQIGRCHEVMRELRPHFTDRKKFVERVQRQQRDGYVLAFVEAGADAVLVDGLTSLDSVRRLSAKASRPFCFHQISGGKSPVLTLTELRDAGMQVAIYSTPCLFAAQAAIEGAMTDLKNADGSLSASRMASASKASPIPIRSICCRSSMTASN